MFTRFLLEIIFLALLLVNGVTSAKERRRGRAMKFVEPHGKSLWILPTQHQMPRAIISLKNKKKFPANFTFGFYEARRGKEARFVDHQIFTDQQLKLAPSTQDQYEFNLTKFVSSMAYNGRYFLHLSETTKYGQKVLATSKKFQVMRVGVQAKVNKKSLRFIENFEPMNAMKKCQPGQEYPFLLTQSAMRPIPTDKHIAVVLRDAETGNEVGRTSIPETNHQQDKNTGGREQLQLKVNIPIPSQEGRFTVEVAWKKKPLFRSDIFECKNGAQSARPVKHATQVDSSSDSSDWVEDFDKDSSDGSDWDDNFDEDSSDHPDWDNDFDKDSVDEQNN